VSTVGFEDDAVTVYLGDCLDVLRELPDASIDAVVTDPPYGLEFMGKEWDSPRGLAAGFLGGGIQAVRALPQYGGQRAPGDPKNEPPPAMVAFGEWCRQWSTELYRVLKPGGHVLAFGGSRTWHRLTVAIEDAGFEIRDSIAWMYASGFPKSMDVSKAIDKTLGAVREQVPVRLANPKAPGPTFGIAGSPREAAAAERGYHVTDSDEPVTEAARRWQGWGTGLKPSFEPIAVGRKPLAGTVANTVLTYGTGALNIDANRVEMSDEDREKFLRGAAAWNDMSVRRGETLANGTIRKAAVIYGEYGIRPGASSHEAGRWPPNVLLDEHAARELDGGSPRGEVSRYFPAFLYTPKAPTSERPRDEDGEVHPTVKPVDLMRWLVRLVTPPGGVVLDPFLGSGTTAEACVVEGFRCVGIERDPSYLRLIRARLARPIQPVLDVEGLW
jgi:DNA modification methylase